MQRLVLLFILALFCLSAQAQLKILATGLSPDELAELRAATPANVELIPVERSQLQSRLADADGILGVLSPQQLTMAPKLRWMQTASAGVDNVLHPALVSSNVTVTNAKIVMGPNIADHAFALLLALTRKINVAVADKQDQAWRRSNFNGKLVELHGKTALVIGVGGIGMQIAQRAKAFGMHVIGIDPKDIPISMLIDETYPPDRLTELLPRADVVFVAAPLTEESRGMMGPAQFEAMKQDSYFIAVSRGPLYQTPPLVKALDSGKLAGAGLDVTDPEPLPPGHALWNFGNVVITPHAAGQGDQMPIRRLEIYKENIRRFAEGKPLLNVVDKQRGY